MTRAMPPPARTARAARSGSGGRRRLLLVIAVTVLGSVAATTGGLVAWRLVVDPPPVTVQVGSTVSLAGMEVTVADFSRRVDAMAGVNTDKAPTSGPAMPMMGMSSMAGMLGPGQERVDVGVRLRNGGDEPQRLVGRDFRLLSGGEPVPLLAPTVSEITDATVPAGARLDGTLTFTIPVGTAPLELAYGDEPVRVVLDRSTGAPAPGGGSGGHGAGHGRS